MSEISLAAFDLDGTALLNDHRSFSERLMKDLDCAYENGIQILPVTGRRWFMTPEALKEKRWNHLMVCANGAEIRDMETGEQLFDDYISKTAAVKIAEEASENDIIMELSGDMYTYLTSEDLVKERVRPDLKFHYETVIIPNARIVSRLSEIVDKINVIKIVLMPDEEKQVQCVRKMLKKLPVYASQTGRHFFEVSAGSSNKGTGLAKACDMLGIDLRNVIYAGDSENDIAAMKTAGISIAMGNASEKIKQLCMHVTEDNMHDGLATALEKYLHLKL